MLRELNWSGIAFGAGAGLVVGLAAAALLGAINGGSFLQVLAQFLAFFVAGYVAGRFSLVGAVAAVQGVIRVDRRVTGQKREGGGG